MIAVSNQRNSFYTWIDRDALHDGIRSQLGYCLITLITFFDLQCTTSDFEGAIAILEPSGFWVAKWQRIGRAFTSWSIFQHHSLTWKAGQFEPGMYAIEMLGELPEDAIEHCENFELEYRAKQSKINKSYNWYSLNQ
jgi:Spt4/RpoE2 zinc finger